VFWGGGLTMAIFPSSMAEKTVRMRSSWMEYGDGYGNGKDGGGRRWYGGGGGLVVDMVSRRCG
jgi:hypothetical protein